MRFRSGAAPILSVTALATTLVVGCAGPAATTAPTAAAPTQAAATPAPTQAAATHVRVAYLKGSSALPVVVMQEQELPAKYNLDVEWQEFVEIDALNSSSATGNTDVNLALSVDTIAGFRNAGQDLVAIYSGLRNHISVISKDGSGIDSLCDLAGHNMGVSDANDAVLAYQWASQCGGGNIAEEVTMLPGPPPVVGTFLADDQADAVRNFEPFQTSLLVGGGVTEIHTETAAWKEEFGQDLLLTTIAAQGDFATANPEAMTNIISMYIEAIEWARDNPEETLEAYAAYVGLEDPEVVAALQERLLPAYTTQWDQDMIDSLNQLLTVLQDAGQLEEIPDGMFSLDYVP